MAGTNPLAQVKTFLKRYTLQQKLALAGSAALVLVLMWALVHFMNRVEYQTLFADLDPQEAQTVVQKLQDLKVQYQLDSDGRTIRVASDKIAEVRIQIASEGMPESGRIGFEIFDRTNFGLTNFQEQVNYQRALEGELARSIMTLAEIDAARVHLVLAKESLFQTADDQTKASVILKFKNGRTLSPAAAQGIVNMVASSVKGLLPEKIVLIDYRGRVLSRNEGADSGLSSQQLDARQKLETEISTKIVQILEPAVGQGKVRPQVSVLMNFQQVEETIEQFDPKGSVIRSQQKQEEHQPRRDVAAGIPGPRSSIAPNPANPAAPPADPTAAQPDVLLKQNETINYEVSKSVRHVVNPVGKVDRVSVAVIIDNHTKVTTGADGKPQTAQEPRNADEMTKYKELVSAAIGINAERGDHLTIENVSFEGETELIEQPNFLEKQGPLMITALRYLIIPIVFVLLYLLFLRPVQKSFLASWLPSETQVPTRALPRLPASMQTPMTVKQLEAQLSGATGQSLGGLPPLDELAPLGGPTKIDMIRKRVVEHAQADPETVARLVRMWLSDEEEMKTGDVKMAATLFVLIGEETAAAVLRYLNESEIEAISREISSADPIQTEEAEKNAEELYSSLVANSYVSEGGIDYAKKVILRTLGAGPGRKILERLSSNYVASNAFEAIERLSPIQLSQFIQNEHPQTIALILAHLKPASSAELLESLPDDLQADVAVRMASLETISQDVIKGISSVLEEKLKPVGTFANNPSYGGIRAVAELLNRMDRRRSRAVLEKIDSDKPEVATSIRELMFVFDDITTLDDMAIREILQRIDKKTIAQALKGATDPQQTQFFRNMSGRAVDMMKEEMELMGPQKIKDVHAAQQRIVEIVRKLEEEGIINLGPGGGDEYVV